MDRLTSSGIMRGVMFIMNNFHLILLVSLVVVTVSAIFMDDDNAVLAIIVSAVTAIVIFIFAIAILPFWMLYLS